MSPLLEQLRRLQDLERESAHLQAEIDAVPSRRLAIESTVTAAQQTLDDLTATIDERQASRRAGDRDVAALQGRLTKYRQQLMTVTNNREYEAVQHEIATVGRELQVLEDTVINWLFEIDELTLRAEAARADVEARRMTADEARAALDRDAEQAQLALAAAQAHIASIRAALDGDARAVYDRVSKRFPRAAVAELRGDLCSGCNVKLRPMLTSDVRRGDRIVQCESCTRILFAIRPPPAAAAPPMP